MSYSTVLGLWPQKKRVRELIELRNSFRLHFVAWERLCVRHLGKEFSLSSEDAASPLWALYQNPKVPRCDRVVLMLTFDLAYVERKDFAQAAEDIREFGQREWGCAFNGGHWPILANVFEMLSKGEVSESPPTMNERVEFLHDYRRCGGSVPALALYGTSVSENPWRAEKHAFRDALNIYEVVK